MGKLGKMDKVGGGVKLHHNVVGTLREMELI